VIETPAFMPVGTQGSVKTVGSEDLERLGYQLVLANTYHLSLRPGSERIEKLGGLHRFMSWSGALLTDSGGYQVMSLSKMRSIDDEGVRFRSHLDGSEMVLTPERAIEIQAQLGVDVSMALDECPPFPCTFEEAEQAMERTHLWAPRNLAARREGQAVFGIVQGGVHPELRARSVEAITALPFDGFAIGGVSVGEPMEMQRPVVTITAPQLPEASIRYLMGVGHPGDIVHAVMAGVDLFDCVLPTRMARHHCLYTDSGRVNASNLKWADDDRPFSEFPGLDRYSRAYLRHLFKCGEPLAARLATLHNLAYYAHLMEAIRDGIASGEWLGNVGFHLSS